MRIRMKIPSVIQCNTRFFISVTGLYVLTFCLVLPFLCNDWAFSKYYSTWWWSSDDMRKRADDVNLDRLHSAQHYFKNLNANGTLKFHQSMHSLNHMDLVIGVVTVQRSPEIGYLTQVMANLDEVFKQDAAFPRKALFLCNTDAGPGIHTEAVQLSRYFPMKSRFIKPSSSDVIMDKFEKEKRDYIFCLQEGLKMRPKHILILEDDAIPRIDALDILRYTLDNLVEYRFKKGDHKHNLEPWAFLKLFYPERWQGYGNEVSKIFEIVGIACIGGTVFTFVNYLYNQRKQQRNINLYCAFVLGAVYFVLLAVLIGRQYVIDLRRISKYLYTVVQAPDCCSPGILYTLDMAKELATYLSDVKCTKHFGIDLAMDKFTQSNSYKRYLVEPNILKHIGLVSSLKSVYKSPQEFL